MHISPFILAAAGLVVALAAPGAAARDRIGSGAIQAGDLATAEAMLDGERAVFPNRPEVLLNLATVYARTGRPSEARALYARVLERDAVELELADGSDASSHALATRGLQHVTTTLTAR